MKKFEAASQRCTSLKKYALARLAIQWLIPLAVGLIFTVFAISSTHKNFENEALQQLKTAKTLLSASIRNALSVCNIEEQRLKSPIDSSKRFDSIASVWILRQAKDGSAIDLITSSSNSIKDKANFQNILATIYHKVTFRNKATLAVLVNDEGQDMPIIAVPLKAEKAVAIIPMSASFEDLSGSNVLLSNEDEELIIAAANQSSKNLINEVRQLPLPKVSAVSGGTVSNYSISTPNHQALLVGSPLIADGMEPLRLWIAADWNIYHNHLYLLLAWIWGASLLLFIAIRLANRLMWSYQAPLLESTLEKLAHLNGQAYISSPKNGLSKSLVQQISSEVKRLEERENSNELFIKRLTSKDFLNLDVDYKNIATNLQNLHQQMVASHNAEEARKIQDEQLQWSNQGIAQFSILLRDHNQSLTSIARSLLAELVGYTKLSQGALFLLEKDEAEVPFLDMVACYAYNRQKMVQKRVETTEGLVGRCFQEQDTIYLEEIPKDYLKITSGLGDALPCSILLIPLKIDDTIVGVLELAGLDRIPTYVMHLIEKIAANTAATLMAVRQNEHTQELLSQTQALAEELTAQEEEMRQNLEELQSTQEEMVRIEQEQKKVQQELYKEKSLFNNLLDNSPENIYFKDLDSRFIRVSKGKLLRHGLNRQEEIIGKCDLDFFRPEDAQKAKAEEQEIIRTRQSLLNYIEKKQKEDGSTSWLLSSKMPLVDLEGRVIGTFGITRDITEHKQLEQELARMKQEYEATVASLMLRIQTLEENKQVIVQN